MTNVPSKPHVARRLLSLFANLTRVTILKIILNLKMFMTKFNDKLFYPLLYDYRKYDARQQTNTAPQY